MKCKWFFTWASTLILVTVLVGCSGEENASGGDGNESQSGEDDSVNLNFHHFVNEENGNWEEVISAFEEEHPGINIELEILVNNMDSQEYLKQLDLLASSGEQLDAIMFPSSLELSKRVEAGMVAPIDSFLEENELNLEEEYNSPNSKIDGSYYGIPTKLVTNLILLNKNHLDEAGLPVPTDWTWDEYKEYAKKLTTEEGNSKRYGSYFHTWPQMYHLLKLLGETENTQILKADGSSNLDNPMIKESLQLRYDMEVEEGTSVPLSETLSQKLNYRQQFFSQSVSMIPTGSFLITQWGAFTPEFEMVWAPWPKNNKEGDSHYTSAEGEIISIAHNSEHKEEAYEFIRWMSTEGMVLQQKEIPAWKNADLTEVVNGLVSNTGNPEAVDVESLIYTLENSIPSEQYIPVVYTSEALDAFNSEAELYLLGEQGLDTTISNAEEKIQEIIDANNN